MQLPKRTLILALIVLGSSRALGEEPAAREQAAPHIARHQKLLDDIRVDTKRFSEDGLPLAQLLELVDKLPKDGHFSLRLDEKAFGKLAPQLLQAPIRLSEGSRKSSLRTALRMALGQLSEIAEVEYALRPEGVVLTRPNLATHTVVYDARDIVTAMPQIFPSLQTWHPGLYRDLKPSDARACIARCLVNEVELRPWEEIQIRNGSQFVVTATPKQHGAISQALEGLRRLADEVVMNARLYEVDRTFYTENIAPLLPDRRDGEDPSPVVPLPEELFKKIVKTKLLQSSEEEKLRPGQTTLFLSRESVVPFVADARLEDADAAPRGSALAGVSFSVRSLVSSDRRCLRLHIEQEVAQLVGVEKAKVLDVDTGKDVVVESPNLRRSTLRGSVDVLDQSAILMPVRYRPPGPDGGKKAWVLVARPFIWLEDEVKLDRAHGKLLTAKSVWESAFPVPAKETPVTHLPLNDDTKAILQALVTDVLTNPALKSDREDFGLKKHPKVAFLDTSEYGWPLGFTPESPGYQIVSSKEPGPFEPRVSTMVLSIDKFDSTENKESIRVSVGLFGRGSRIGNGCSLNYQATRKGGRWTVEHQSTECQ